MIYALGKAEPQLHKNHYVAENSVVVGNVIISEGVSVWFNAVIRGDTDLIKIGKNSNIQDGAVLHTDEGIQLVVGENVTVGHRAVLHGCTVGDGSLIGINSVILNNAIIGKNCLIGANSLITEGKRIPDNSLVMGSPGKVVRVLSEEEITLMQTGTKHYVENAALFKKELRAL